jgi:hypothetical protein
MRFRKTSIISCLIVTLLLFCGTFIFIDDSFPTNPTMRFFLQNEKDDYGFCSIESRFLKTRSQIPPGIALIGTAAMREALLEEEQIAELLYHATGNHAAIYNFMTGGQSALEMAEFSSIFAKNFQGAVVLGISPSRLSADPSELQGLINKPRLAFVSQATVEEALSLGLAVKKTTGIYLLDNYQFFAARQSDFIRNIFFGPPKKRLNHAFLGKSPLNQNGWGRNKQILQSRLGHYDEFADRNLGSFERAINLLNKSQGIAIVLLDIPINPRAMKNIITPKFYRRHQEKMKLFADKMDVLYLNFNNIINFSADDFQDWSHIRTENAQIQFTKLLVKNLGEFQSVLVGQLSENEGSYGENNAKKNR